MPAKDVGPILERWGMFFPFGDRNTAERFPVVTFSLVAANLIVYAAFLLFVFFEHEGAFLYINWAFVPAQFGSTGQFVTLFGLSGAARRTPPEGSRGQCPL
jgi:hypothetical protein